MLALQISSMKAFMHHILVSDTFDIFLLEEAVIKTAYTYTIDGHTNQDFFTAGEQDDDRPPYEFAPWSDMKGICYQLIKGRHTPLYFKFVLHLKPAHMEKLLSGPECGVDASQVKALVVTVKYDGEKALLTTGCSLHTFLPTKEPDILWDKAMRRFLDKKGLACQEL